ncbi:MAG: hypothetical protein DRO99_03680 [Candidatus Aenigmatarchaeota archaeon]|nr:MAG: hypothetical protein DRO99_03680 [Candidatus Aenigmarchaeota archaeon]
MATKAIIFDLWNTLAYNKGAGKNPILMLEEKLGLNMDLYREVEQGFMTKKFGTKKEAMISLCKHIGVKPRDMLIDSLVYMWEHMQLNVSLFPDVVPVLQKLRKKYKIGLISNTECFTTKEFLDKGYGKHFDYIAFSCDLGMLKPDPSIFRVTMHELGSKPEETVMVGDNLMDDVLAAEKLGMKGLLIKRDFAKYGAKPSHLESGTHKNVIRDLTELQDYLD